jgi:type II secretory pathway pseudopilin PulG
MVTLKKNIKSLITQIIKTDCADKCQQRFNLRNLPFNRCNHKNQSGITLIEILAVIGIIIILAAVVTPVSLSIMKKAYIKKAQAMIAQLEGALALYYNEYGMYPPTYRADATAGQLNGNRHDNVDIVINGLTYNNLVNALTAPLAKNGPYISFKSNDLDISVTNKPVLLDPWGMPYVYVCQKYFSGGSMVDVPGNTQGPWWPNTGDHKWNTYNIYSFGPDGKSYGGNTDTGYNRDPGDGTYDDAFDAANDGHNVRGYDGDTNNDDDINNWSQQD